MSEAYTAAERRRFPQTSRVREEARRIDERLEATLRIPDVQPTAILVIAHALPTHGGTMRTPIMAAIARPGAEPGWGGPAVHFPRVGPHPRRWGGAARDGHDLDARPHYA